MVSKLEINQLSRTVYTYLSSAVSSSCSLIGYYVVHIQ